jgi:hypothetical protein
MSTGTVFNDLKTESLRHSRKVTAPMSSAISAVKRLRESLKVPEHSRLEPRAFKSPGLPAFPSAFPVMVNNLKPMTMGIALTAVEFYADRNKACHSQLRFKKEQGMVDSVVGQIDQDRSDLRLTLPDSMSGLQTTWEEIIDYVKGREFAEDKGAVLLAGKRTEASDNTAKVLIPIPPRLEIQGLPPAAQT